MRMQRLYQFGIVTCLTSLLLLGLAFGHGVQAATYARPTKTSVIPPDWVGTWNCNLDGRRAEITLGFDSTSCEGGICRTTPGAGPLAGYVKDRGNEKPIRERSRNSNDLSSSRQDHMLPLRYNNSDDWMLMMHTWDRRYASGYTTWQNIPFGLQCRKR